MITQNVINPASAPRVVVAINSPEPTMEAESIKLGPRNLRRSLKVEGGCFILSWDSK
jgi:hypothetical protein